MKKFWIIGVVVILVLFGINLPSMKPSCPAPDTTAPHTTAPIITGDDTSASSPDITTAETTVPDTTVQETTNPETTVPDTTESATTPAPDTTKVPETTKAPDTTATPSTTVVPDTTVSPETETPHSHTYEAVVTVPTCTEAGYTTYTCACGDNYVANKVAATGHSYDTVVTTAPTCTEAGEEKRTCSCGAVETKAIPAKGHTEVTVKGKAATCTDKGLTDGKKCSVCDTVTVKQTAIPAKGHTEVTVSGKAATCTDPGLTDGKKCSVCKTVTVEQKPIAANGHKWDSGTVSGNTKTYKCTVCKTTKTETVSTCSHTYGPWQWEAYTFEHYTGDAWFDEFYGPSTETSHRKFRVCSKCGYRDVEEHDDHICAAYISATVLCDNCVEGKDTYFVCGICGWNWTTHEESSNHEHIKEENTYIEASECTEKTHQLKVTCLDCGEVGYSYPIRPTWEDNYDPALGISILAITTPNAYNPNPDPNGINWMVVWGNVQYDANGYITSFDVHWHDKDQNCKVATIVVAEVKQTFIDWGYTFPEGSRRGVEIAIYDGYYVPMRQTGTS